MTTESRRLELLLGLSLGPFRIGDTLYSVLSLLRQAKEQWPRVDVSWDEAAPSSAPLLITLASLPLKLLFDAQTQVLALIELSDPGQHVSFKGQPIAVDEGRATRRGLARIFGPTEAPKPHPSASGELLVVYPGAAFGISSDSASTHQITRLVVTAVSHTVTTENVYAAALTVSPARLASQIERIDISLTTPTTLLIHFPLSAKQESLRIVLGETSAEDLRIDLGPPARHFHREDNRLAIHSSGDATNEGPRSAYFANYFDLGIDFLLDSLTNRLLKVTLHSNTPGEALFGRYARVLWRIERDGKTMRSTDKSTILLAALAAQKTLNREAPLVLDRHADVSEGLVVGKTTEIHGFPGLALEVTQNDEVETCWLF